MNETITGYVKQFKGTARVTKIEHLLGWTNYECVMDDGPFEGEFIYIEKHELRRKA